MEFIRKYDENTTNIPEGITSHKLANKIPNLSTYYVSFLVLNEKLNSDNTVPNTFFVISMICPLLNFTLKGILNSYSQDSKGVKVPDVNIIEYTFFSSNLLNPIPGSKQFIDNTI